MRVSSGPAGTREHPRTKFLHARLWEQERDKRGPKAPFSVTPFEPPVDELTEEFPLRLTTGRRLDSYNTGVQTGGYTSPLRRGETIDMSPEDAARLGLEEGEVVRVSSRRGSLRVPARVDRGLRPGLVFMTLHFPDQVDTNILTIDATDPGQDGRVQGERGPDREDLRVGGGVAPPWTWSSPTLSPATMNAPPWMRCSVPDSGWSGGERTEADGRVARGGHEARGQRHLLLPVLHALQSSAGWISPGGLRYACERLTVPPAEAYGVATFYAMFSVEPRPTTVLHLCDDFQVRLQGRGRRRCDRGGRPRGSPEQVLQARVSACANERRRHSCNRRVTRAWPSARCRSSGSIRSCTAAPGR